MSVKYIGWAFAQAGLAHGPKFVLVALADIANDEGWAWPGTKKIGEKVGMARTTVSRHLRHLEELKVISIEARTGSGGRQTTNGYQLWMTPPSQNETGAGDDVQTDHPPVSDEDTPPSQAETAPVSDDDTLKEPSPYSSNGTVTAEAEDARARATLPPWFGYLLEIKGRNPVRENDYPTVRAWVERKGYSDALLEAVAEDLLAKWGTPHSAKRPWPYTDVRGTFQKWCRLEAELRADVPVELASKREEPVGAVTRNDSGIWKQALERLEVQVTRPSFNTWFARTVGLGYTDDGTLVVGVENDGAVQMLELRMYSVITRILADLGASNVVVAFKVKEPV